MGGVDFGQAQVIPPWSFGKGQHVCILSLDTRVWPCFPFSTSAFQSKSKKSLALLRNCPKLLRFSCCLCQQALNFCMSPFICFLCGLCQGSFMNRLLRVGAFSNGLKSDLNLHVAPQIQCAVWHWCPTLVFCRPLMMGNFLFTVHSRCVHTFLRLVFFRIWVILTSMRKVNVKYPTAKIFWTKLGPFWAVQWSHRSVRMWAVTGEQLMEMVGHTAIVYSVAAHASGDIASGSEDGFAKIWKGQTWLYCSSCTCSAISLLLEALPYVFSLLSWRKLQLKVALTDLHKYLAEWSDF